MALAARTLKILIKKKLGKIVSYSIFIAVGISSLVACVDGPQQPFTAPAEQKTTALPNSSSFAQVKPIFQRACTTCHANRATYEEAAALAAKIGPDGLHERIAQKKMPLPGSPEASLVSDEDRKIILGWIACGAPKEEKQCEKSEVTAEESVVVTQEQGPSPSVDILACARCHGFSERLAVTPSGISQPIPNLAGQHYEYLEDHVLAYKGGHRKNAIMASVVSNIPDDKLKELVEYYSRITPTRNNGKSLDQEPINFNPSLYEKGKASAGMCLGCHFATPSGGTANTTTPRIAGQQKDYIAAQLRAFKSGDRVNESMQIFARMIQEEDIDAIAYYFSVLPYEPPAAQ